MPSPFPGMDPYIECSALWTGFHHSLITFALEDLQPKLGPKYIAVVERRVTVEPVPKTIIPDISIVDTDVDRTWQVRKPAAVYAEIAVLDELAIPEPTGNGYLIETEWLEVPQGFVEIRTIEGGEVVTVIEVLSPSNKKPGRAREQYLVKQQEALDSSVNLVEIDLLRAGLHTLAAPEDRLRPADYRVCVRFGHRTFTFYVIDISLRKALAPIPIPLRRKEKSISLDLPALFTRCYDVGRFDSQVDYRQPPDPHLKPEDELWADALLRERGLRE